MSDQDRLPAPQSVTRQQVIDACSALGLDANKVGHLEISRDARTVWVELFDVGTRFPRKLIDAGTLRPVTLVEIEVTDP